MFTGIVEEVGLVKSIKRGANSMVLTIEASKVTEDLKLGDSIATNGVCLTVTSFGNSYFCADVMHETMNRSSLGSLKIGSGVNLERAMQLNGRFGGHIVSGHIDGTGEISKIDGDDNAIWYTIKAPKNIMKYIVEKGSITIDGISLTVAALLDNDTGFKVSIIPHTRQQTTLSQKKTGDIVNLENDMVGKYIERFISFNNDESTNKKESKINTTFLMENGFL